MGRSKGKENAVFSPQMANNIEIKSVDWLKPYDRNARTHSETQLDEIAASIAEFGFTNPILASSDGTIIAGHGRLEASTKRLGLTEVPVVILDYLTDAQRRAYIIADNKIALNAGWDDKVLGEELHRLEKEGFNLDLTGFDNIELEDILAPFSVEEEEEEEDSDQSPNEDEDIPLPDKPTSVVGDIWLLGGHRVICGDGTKPETLDALMLEERADLVFTDPPYNTGMVPGKDKPGSKVRLGHMFNDSYTDEEWEKFMADFCKAYHDYTKKDCFLYICLDWRRSHELVPHLKKRWKFSNLIIWDKVVHGLGSDYKYTHEFIHVCKKGDPKPAENRDGEKEYQDVWRIMRKMGHDDEHATKKPIELCARAIRHSSRPSEIVLDIFGGSGSTLIASEDLRRRCRMVELDPAYVDVIVMRWQRHTGEKAILESTGRTFANMKAERTNGKAKK